MKQFFILFYIVCATPFMIHGQTGMDLKITDVIIKPANPSVGDALVISYKVVNAGNLIIPGGTYSVSLTINKEIVSFDDDTETLTIGQSATYSKVEGTYHKLIDKKGAYHWEIKVKTKFKDVTPENNTQKGTILVQ
jgi:hypothetical protein